MIEPTSNSDQPATRSTGVFVGREREFDDLKVALSGATEGRGQMVMLVGEPGIGKTRLAQELTAYADAQGAKVLWGWCYEEEGAPPYWPWLQAIGSYIERQDAGQLSASMGSGAAHIAELLPSLRVKLPDLPDPTPLEPEQARFRLFDSITNFLKNASQARPLLIVLDDLHWADQASLLLLEFLTRAMASSHLMLVGTYRDIEVSRKHPLSETLGSLMRQQLFRRIHLDGLTQQEVSRFAEVSGGLPLPVDALELVHRRTEGNPLFVSEIVRLFNQGDLNTDTGWTATVPEGIRDALGRRLNRLSNACNETLTIASVIGREFTLLQLNSLIEEMTEDQILEVLEEAFASHVIEELPRSIDSYRFTHALMQETLTDEMSLTRRVRLHARIATVLEELYASSANTHAAELAYHFAQAETVTGTDKLVEYSLLAGEQALAAFAYEEALVLFQGALEAKQGLPYSVNTMVVADSDAAALLFGFARAQIATVGRTLYPEFYQEVRMCFDYYVGAGDVDAALAVAEYPSPRVIYPDARRTGLLSAALLLVPPDSIHAGLLLGEYGSALYHETGDSDAAQEALGRALIIAKKEHDLALEMRVLTHSAEIDLWTLNWGEVPPKGRRAIELAGSLGDPTFQVTASYFMVRALAGMGQLQEAQQLAEAMIVPAEHSRSFPPLRDAHWSNGTLHRAAGDWQDARRFLDHCVEALSELTRASADLAVLNLQVGNLVQGRENVDRVLANPPAGVT